MDTLLYAYARTTTLWEYAYIAITMHRVWCMPYFLSLSLLPSYILSMHTLVLAMHTRVVSIAPPYRNHFSVCILASMDMPYSV